MPQALPRPPDLPPPQRHPRTDSRNLTDIGESHAPRRRRTTPPTGSAMSHLKAGPLAHMPEVIWSPPAGVHDVVDGGNEALGVRRGRGYLVPSITTTRG